MAKHAPAHSGTLRWRALVPKAFLLLPTLVAAACGSGESAPQGAASGGAAMAPTSPAPARSPEVPAGNTLVRDTAAAEPAPVIEGAPRAPSLAPPSTSAAPSPSPSAASASIFDQACKLDAPGASFEQSCASCAGADACASCLCSACTDEVQLCAQTPGCLDILACARSSGCGGMDCYCGSADAVSCLNGKADGACRAAIETAPGGRAPSVREPSAGPAADGASALAQCLQREEACRSACAAPELVKH